MRDIRDGFSYDYSDSQLDEEELEQYKTRQDKYLQEDYNQMMARFNRPAQYFPSLITEVGPYKPVIKATENQIEYERNRRKIIDRKLGRRP